MRFRAKPETASTTMAPTMLPMSPVVLKSNTRLEVTSATKKPPTSEPTMPSNIVMTQPMDWRPGTSARAMRPATRPTIKKSNIDMAVLRVWRRDSVRRRQGLEALSVHTWHRSFAGLGNAARLLKSAARQRGPAPPRS